ncbi:MAG: NAD-dependent succinate-semialdehyde dehydrogenase [Rhodospirillales bacterium]|nr:NAD-dependent succinate-semialdehyde dehydrogenase [Rhodospirillales bacterium]
MRSVNPATGETIRDYPEAGEAEVEDAVARSAAAFVDYRRSDSADRSLWLGWAAAILDQEKDALARLIVEEMGKPLKAAVSEVDKCAWACRFYAEHGARFLADEEIRSDAAKSFIRYLPLGPVLAVMPWNFPFWQVFRFAAPALMAGNTGLLKHASNVPGCALAIADVFARAGFPDGVFQSLLVGSSAVARILDDPRVVAATLTGSDGAGARVGAGAGEAIKRTVLELGGSDPFIVMPSADPDRAAAVAVTARTINNGQSCIAAKRFIVHADVYERFEARLVEGLEALKVGDPMADDTDIGPLATPDIRDEVEAQVAGTVEAGARLLCGGRRGDGRGNFYLPTALADIPQAAPAYREEVFGPVALLFRVDSIDAAIALANDSPYGLASSVWTEDEGERARFINEIEAGQTFVNAMVASDPRLPFGGIKRSGYGRELGALGIREFVNIKTVSISS